MVAQRIIQHANGLETLRALLESNPKDIIAAHEEARKQLVLTKEQEERYDSALGVLAMASDVEAEHKAKEESLALSVADHAQNVEALQAEKAGHAEYVASKNADINAKYQSLSDAIGKFEEDKKKIASDMATADFSMKQRESAVQKKEEENIRAAEANATESQKLDQKRAAMTKKAQLIAQAEAIEE